MKRSIFLAVCFFAAFLVKPKLYAQTCYADAGRDTTICPGKCVTLGGPVPAADTSFNCFSVAYRWTPSAGLDNANSPHPNACPGTTTVYTLTAYFFGRTPTDTCCVTRSTVTITISSTCSYKKETGPTTTLAGITGECDAGLADSFESANRLKRPVLLRSQSECLTQDELNVCARQKTSLTGDSHSTLIN